MRRFLNDLAKRHIRGLTPEPQEDILTFYQDLNAPIVTKKHPGKWRKTLRELAVLKSASVRTESASR
jgi:hypothetical protein